MAAAGSLAAGAAMAEAKKNHNQLKAVAATVAETATMTATTTTMKMKAMALLTAARRAGGKSMAEAGSAINIFQTGIVCCLIECFNLEEPI